MSGRFLDFKSYLGGASNVLFLEAFPRTQKTYAYNYDADVSGYTFSADYQSVLLSNVTYNNITGEPNLTSTEVSGYFTNTANISGSLIDTDSAATGIVNFTGGERVSKYDFSVYLAKAFGFDSNIIQPVQASRVIILQTDREN